MPFGTFLKRVDSGLYNQYRIESFGHKDPEVVHAEKVTEESFDHDSFVTLLHSLPTLHSLPKNHEARLYANKRHLPLDLLYWAENFGNWTNKLVAGKLDEKIIEGRIIIPVYSFKKKFFAFLGRSIDPKQKLRYILIVLDKSHPLLYGLDRYDPTKKGIAVEGPLDSLFLPNSIALLGSNLAVLDGLGLRNKIIICYDNEPHSKETKAKIELAIDRGYKVVIWPRYISYKDINQMIVAGWSSNYIKEVVDSNTFSGLRARIALSEWSSQ